MPRHRTHTLNPRHLAVLQWMHLFSVNADRPEGWVKESRVMKGMRMRNHLLAVVNDATGKPIDVDRNLVITACGEEFHDLRVKLNSDDPFIITHPNGTRYRISKPGRKIAATCTIKTITIEGPNGPEPKPIVVLAATGKPPVIRSTDDIPAITDDDEDEDDDTPVVNTGVDPDQGVTQANPEPEEVENDQDDEDEINNPQPIAPKRPQTRPAAAPPKRPPMAMKPQPAKPRPAHTKARVPATTDD